MDEQTKQKCNEARRIELETKREKLINWLEKEIAKAERKIDRGGPFIELESRMETLEEILERLY